MNSSIDSIDDRSQSQCSFVSSDHEIEEEKIILSSLPQEDAPVQIPGLWKYSKTRQFTFWIRKSIRDVINPELNVVFEDQSVTKFEDEIGLESNNNIRHDDHDNHDQQEKGVIGHDSYYHNHMENNNSNNSDRYQNCENIDDAMIALHTLIPNPEYDISIPRHLHSFASPLSSTSTSTFQHTYDWLLDGDPDDYQHAHTNGTEEDNLYSSSLEEKECQSWKTFGDEALDNALQSMELEDSPTNTPSRSTSFSVDGTAEEYDPVTNDEGSLESNFDVNTDYKKYGTKNNHCANMDKYLVLINNENLVLTPKAHNHTPRNNDFHVKNDSKDIGDFDCILDYLPSSLDKKHMIQIPQHHHKGEKSHNITTPKTVSRCSNDVDEFECILDHLPYEDPSTPEGKFFRTLKMEHEQQSLDVLPNCNDNLLFNRLNDLLSSGYDSPDFDPILELFGSIPWDKEVVEDDDNESHDEAILPIDQIDNFLIEKLSALDEISQQVTNQLLFQIKQKEGEINDGMNLLHATDCDITNALSNVKEAKMYLQRARGRDEIDGRDGITGGLHIIKEANHRDKLYSLDTILQSCEELFAIEQNIILMSQKLDSKTLLSRSNFMECLIEKCKKLKETVSHDEECTRLECLYDLRQRVTNLMGFLCQHLENGLITFISERCLFSKWSEESIKEYDSLFISRLDVHHFYVLEIVDNRKLINDDNADLPRLADIWSESILMAHCFEAELSLARALLDPTVVDDNLSKLYSSGDFDQNLIEMRSKLNNLQAFHDDAASLRSTTNNLLSIRFEFDRKNDMLQWVLHKLCFSFSQVLYSYGLIMNRHKYGNDSNDQDLSQQHNQTFVALESRKIQLWSHCKSLIVLLLQSFTNSKKHDEDVTFNWAQELEMNYDVLKLCSQMCQIAYRFTGCEKVRLISNDDCELWNALQVMYQKYIKSIHVDAMTEIGTMMATDTWALLPIPIEMSSDSELSKTERLQCMLQEFFINLHKSETSTTSQQIRPWYNAIEENFCKENFLDSFLNKGNPFAIQDITTELKVDLKEDKVPIDHDLFKKVAELLAHTNMQFTISTQTALNGVGRWTIRLLTIRQKLPLVSDEITSVIRNIYDLYLLTVFRLCIGNSVSEDILLGNIKRSDSIFNATFPQDLNPSTSQLIATSKLTRSHSFNRKRQPSSELKTSSKPSQYVTISRYCDADIYSPLESDEKVLSPTRAFVRRARESLSGKVALEQIEKWKLSSSIDLSTDAIYLEKRIAAAFSCLFISCILDVSLHMREFCADEQFENRDAPITDYLHEMIHAVNHMHVLCLQMSTIRAIRGTDVVRMVLSAGNGCAWAGSRLNEHCNDYVETLVDRCTSLLHHLTSSQLRHQPTIISETWDSLVESGFLSLLEGFAKVYDCSTEGRALMSMDLSSYYTALPPASPKRGMQYVDMYIKVFYFPKEDILNWIDENRNQYHLYHLLTLVSLGAHNQLSEDKLRIILNHRERIMNLSVD